MKKTIKLTTVSLATAAFLVGCGGSSSDTLATADTSTGYFIDAKVAGADYETSSGIKGKTDALGRFQYKNGDSVKLHIGKLTLGEAQPGTEGLLTPASLAKGDIALKNLLLRTLQALDADNNTSNGIEIPAGLLTDINETSVAEHNESSLLELDTTLSGALDEDYDGHIDVDETEAQTHFEESLTSWNDGERPDAENGNTNSNGHGNSGESSSSEGDSLDLDSYPRATLTNTQKYALAYMWNEEKLAKDIYIALNEIQPLKQLENIATRSEVKHEQMVEDLVERYDINITNLDTYEIKYTESELRALPAGTYGIDAIQALYNTLYDKGIGSTRDALEVGCMVEVTDVNDLNDYITVAQEVNATDLIDTFDKLREGSYSHYWAFDKGLQKLGITTGCCSLGTIDGVDYCQPDYPKK